MSIVVNLRAELEKTIAAEAAKAGMTLSDYVAGRLAKVATTNGSHGSKRRLTGTELMQRWKELGLIGYRTDGSLDSQTRTHSDGGADSTPGGSLDGATSMRKSWKIPEWAINTGISRQKTRADSILDIRQEVPNTWTILMDERSQQARGRT